MGVGEYYGFSVDKDRRYVLANFIVTHNTAVQGQQDLMIGIGQSKDLKERSQIMLSFPKNKLTAPLQPFVCKIDYVTQRVMGLKK